MPHHSLNGEDCAPLASAGRHLGCDATLGSARARLLVWLLAWALLLAPVLGQMHRALHAAGEGAPPAVATASAGLPSVSQAPAHVHASWLHDLFGGHSPAQCQLLDQLHHGLAGPPTALQLAHALPIASGIARPHTEPRQQWQAAFFDARAPPGLA